MRIGLKYITPALAAGAAAVAIAAAPAAMADPAPAQPGNDRHRAGRRGPQYCADRRSRRRRLSRRRLGR